MQWNAIPCSGVDLLGSTTVKISNDVFILGGVAVGPSNNNHLSIRCFDLSIAELKPVVVNTCGVANRAYHTASSTATKTILFGGELSDGSVTSEVVSCSLGDDGFVSRVVRKDGPPRKGMVGGVVGPHTSLTVLFGGSNGHNYFSDIVLVRGDACDPTSTFEYINLEGEKPSPRAFCSVSVCGEHKQYLVITGGFDGKEIFDDIWILDVTKSIRELNKSDVDAAPAGGKAAATKPGKGAPTVEEPAKWTRFSSVLPKPCFWHSSFSSKVGHEGIFSVNIVGGLSKLGALPLAPMEIKLSLPSSGAVANAMGPVSISAEGALECNGWVRYGCSTLAISDNNGEAALALCFGGVSGRDSIAGGTNSLFAAISSSSALVSGMTATVARRQAEENKRQRALAGLSENADTEEKDNRVEFTAPNGDQYYGEVLPENNVPHGEGKMNFSDGSTYTV